jgi:hypothetical protein
LVTPAASTICWTLVLAYHCAGEELHGGMGHVFGDAGVLHRTAQPIARMLAPPSITTV